MLDFLKKSNCDVCNREVRKSELVTISKMDFCCYSCYDKYLRTLNKDEWLEFFTKESKR